MASIPTNINKIVKRDGTILLDLSYDTVTPSTLRSGITALNANGSLITGTLTTGLKSQDRFTYYMSMPNSLGNIEFGSNAKNIPASFFGGKSITSMYGCENIQTIGSAAFSYVSFTNKIMSFPNCHYVNSHAFCYTNITSIYFPRLNYMGEGAFRECSNLTDIDIGLIKEIPPYAFQNCSQLTTLSYKTINSVKQYAFYSCTNLRSITIGNYSTSSMTGYPVTTAATIGSSAFYNCQYLSSVVYYGNKICANAFKNCYRLVNLTVFEDCEIENINAFDSTPVKGLSTYTTSTVSVSFIRKNNAAGYIGWTSPTYLLRNAPPAGNWATLLSSIAYPYAYAFKSAILGTNTVTTTAADPEPLFKFIPSNTRVYSFAGSTGNGFDTIGILADSTFRTISYNGDSGGSSQFLFSCNLTGGSTYYFLARGYNSITYSTIKFTIS